VNRTSTPEARLAAIRERSARCTGRALSRGGRKRGLDRAYLLERLDAANAIGEAWQALAKAERAYAGAKDFGDDKCRAAAFEACAKATAALHALGIDPVKP
jgi:hypothetical protein